MTKVHDASSTVVAESGDVLIDGPAGVTFSLTPEAATETAALLRATAIIAQQQRDDAEST